MSAERVLHSLHVPKATKRVSILRSFVWVDVSSQFGHASSPPSSLVWPIPNAPSTPPSTAPWPSSYVDLSRAMRFRPSLHPPTRTIPWDIPGTKTIPSGDYQGTSALPVISFFMTLAACAVVLSLLSRFGVMRHLVKMVDACIFVTLVILLAPIAILVHVARRGVHVVRHPIFLSQHVVALKLHHIHTQIIRCIVHSKRLLSGVFDSIKLGVGKSLVNIGSACAVALLVLPVALLIHLVDFTFVLIEQKQDQRLDQPVPDPPDPRPDPPPDPRVASRVEAQDVDAHSNHTTTSYATAQGANTEPLSGNTGPSQSTTEHLREDTSNARTGRQSKRCILKSLDHTMLRVKDQLGRGGFGEVLKVEDKTTGKVYAIKKVHRSRDKQEQAVVFHEVSCHLRMADDAAVPVIHGFYEDPWRFYILMDCGRRCFADLFTALTVDSVRFYAAQLVLGLQSLRNRGILHRDLKSDILLLGVGGNLVIIDFGLARSFEDPKPDDWDNPHYTRMKCGTKGYTCAEMEMNRFYSFNADSWSFGVVLYEWLAAGEASRWMLFILVLARLTHCLYQMPAFHLTTIRSCVYSLTKYFLCATVNALRTGESSSGIQCEALSTTGKPMRIAESHLQPSTLESILEYTLTLLSVFFLNTSLRIEPGPRRRCRPVEGQRRWRRRGEADDEMTGFVRRPVLVGNAHQGPPPDDRFTTTRQLECWRCPSPAAAGVLGACS
ncbi:kinase-like domain-containing protein [Roridomyces roridus]|uniref:Kinase-like domain-containing protein n=1 Tax=Roridomyces roridus TaxID=1738132 RepID=A0AAD7CE95_9AGAR|nr:kinase-like domain-containing protein [Roridomyces roridus]